MIYRPDKTHGDHLGNEQPADDYKNEAGRR